MVPSEMFSHMIFPLSLIIQHSHVVLRVLEAPDQSHGIRVGRDGVPRDGLCTSLAHCLRCSTCSAGAIHVKWISVCLALLFPAWLSLWRGCDMVQEPQRPQFRGLMKEDPITGVMQRFYSSSARTRKFIVSGLVIFGMVHL